MWPWIANMLLKESRTLTLNFIFSRDVNSPSTLTARDITTVKNRRGLRFGAYWNVSSSNLSELTEDTVTMYHQKVEIDNIQLKVTYKELSFLSTVITESCGRQFVCIHVVSYLFISFRTPPMTWYTYLHNCRGQWAALYNVVFVLKSSMTMYYTALFSRVIITSAMNAG